MFSLAKNLDFRDKAIIKRLSVNYYQAHPESVMLKVQQQNVHSKSQTC